MVATNCGCNGCRICDLRLPAASTAGARAEFVWQLVGWTWLIWAGWYLLQRFLR